MGLFGKSKKEREKEYMNRLDVPLCLKEDFELIIDDVFTIMGVGTVATGNISTGMCREGENACVYKANGGVLETIITTIDIHTKERKSNGCGYKTEHVGLGLRGVSKEQLEKGDGFSATVESVISYLSHIRDGSENDIFYRQSLVNIYVDSVYLYDTSDGKNKKISVHLNTRNGVKEIPILNK